MTAKFFLLLVLLSPSLWAKKATGQLLFSVSSVPAGQEFLLGLKLKLEDGYHVYYLNTGDSGTPVRVSFAPVPGLNLSDPLWQIPEILEQSGLFSYAYENEFYLLWKASLTQSSSIQAKADYLICNKDMCIPERAILERFLATGSLQITSEAEKLHSLLLQVPPVRKSPMFWEDRPENLILHIQDPELKFESGHFIPDEGGMIKIGSVQELIKTSSEMLLKMQKTGLKPYKAPAGLLIAKDNTLRLENPSASEPLAEKHKSKSEDSVFLYLFLAFTGGILLNFMPCVFPVLSLKILDLTHDSKPIQRMLDGAFYTLGVLLCFTVLGLVSLNFHGGSWGFQMQESKFVLFLAWILLLAGFGLSGFFELRTVLPGFIYTLMQKNGFVGSFFTGCLTTLVATPCTAPFMASALGWSLTQTKIVAFLIFLVTGFGVAFPYLLLSLWPGLTRLLPRPGAWMITLRELLAYPLYFSVCWLLWVLSSQLSPESFLLALCSVPLFSMILWIGQKKPLLGFLLLMFPVLILNVLETKGNSKQLTFSRNELKSKIAEGRKIIVDATADWCITCKVNASVALKPKAMQDFFKAEGVELLEADWTSQDPEITAWLKEFGRNGVPLVVFYAPGREPVVLPQILTPQIVKSVILNQ